jgi:predicted RNA-binding protein with TRAM domain
MRYDLKIGDEIELLISKLGNKGDPVGWYQQHLAVIVTDAPPTDLGKTIKVKIVMTNPSYVIGHKIG